MEQAQVSDKSQNMADAAVTVQTLGGNTVATVQPIPDTIASLKVCIEESVGMPRALQKLVKQGDFVVYSDEDMLDPTVACAVCLLQDETPMWTWDFDGNPNKDQIEVEGPIVKCPSLRTDYINVITKEPIRKGTHYFEFVMHYIGDEQSCGLVANPSQAGNQHGLRELDAWTYYPGRMHSTAGTIRDGKGALHAKGRAVQEFKKLKREGDVIGMLADLERGAVAFSLNGELQGACEIPTQTPLWIITHVDTHRDCVELRKHNIEEAPPANLEALQGALIDLTQGLKLGYS